MKINYTKKRFHQHLIFGLIWSILGLLNLYYSQKNNWLDYGFLVVALLYWSRYLYERSQQYLTVDDTSIKKNSLFGKEVNLSEINWVKKHGSNYILKTQTEDFTINAEVINQVSLVKLHEILADLNLPADRTAFFEKVSCNKQWIKGWT